jgi:hypothetical protein
MAAAALEAGVLDSPPAPALQRQAVVSHRPASLSRGANAQPAAAVVTQTPDASEYEISRLTDDAPSTPASTAASQAAAATHDIDRLAEEVLDRLRWRLAIERERLME